MNKLILALLLCAACTEENRATPDLEDPVELTCPDAEVAPVADAAPAPDCSTPDPVDLTCGPEDLVVNQSPLLTDDVWFAFLEVTEDTCAPLYADPWTPQWMGLTLEETETAVVVRMSALVLTGYTLENNQVSGVGYDQGGNEWYFNASGSQDQQGFARLQNTEFGFSVRVCARKYVIRQSFKIVDVLPLTPSG